MFLIVIVGISLLVIRSTRDTSSPSGRDGQIADGDVNPTHPDHRGHTRPSSKPPPPGETEHTGYWDGDVWHKTPLVGPPKRKPSTSRQKSGLRAASNPDTALPSLNQWTHGTHAIGHSHPPKKPYPDYADYGLSQEQIDRIKERFAQEVSTYRNTDEFRGILEQIFEAGKTFEKWEAEQDRKRVDILTAEMDAINAFKYLEAASEHYSNYSDYVPELAVRAVVANPDFLEGHLYLARRESDADRAIESYRAIVSHPDVHTSLSPKDTVSAFDSLGYLLSMDQPVEAIKYLKQAHADFVKYQELSQKELDDFLQWAETIMNADAPMDTNNFLMKEMEAHLKGGQPQFAPDRIIRAFETLERYSPAEGIKRLQKNDPDVAAQVQRLLSAKRKPTLRK